MGLDGIGLFRNRPCGSGSLSILTVNISKYYDLLSKEAKARYEEKLRLTGLSLEEYPYCVAILDHMHNNG